MNSRPQTAGSAGFKCNEIVALEESYNLTVQAHDLDAGRWKRLVETLLSQLGVDLLERNRIGAMRPVSNTMGRQFGAFAKLICDCLRNRRCLASSEQQHPPTRSAHARSQATPYPARARHSANAIERLCL